MDFEDVAHHRRLATQVVHATILASVACVVYVVFAWKAHSRALDDLDRIVSAIELGDSTEQVLALCASESYDSLACEERGDFVHIDSSGPPMIVPPSLAQYAMVHVRDGRVIAIQVRSLDEPSLPPPRGPADRGSVP